MQNKYVGDMGDFGKFGLLRWLCGMREDVASDGLGRPKLGVVWYLNKNDDRNDGKIRDYLEDLSSTFYLCDIDLFAALKQTLQPEHRSINFLRKSEFILPGAKFYRECVHCYSGKVRRAEWLRSALCKVDGSDLVFADPDNGISLAKRPRYSAKHTYLQELKEFSQQGEGKSLVVYHHAPRKTASEEIFHLSQQLQNHLKLPVRSLWYHRGTARFYFVVIHPNHERVLSRRLESFGKSAWCTTPRFTLIP